MSSQSRTVGMSHGDIHWLQINAESQLLGYMLGSCLYGVLLVQLCTLVIPSSLVNLTYLNRRPISPSMQ